MSMMWPPERVKMVSIPSALRARATRWPPVMAWVVACVSRWTAVAMTCSCHTLGLGGCRLLFRHSSAVLFARLAEVGGVQLLERSGQLVFAPGALGVVKEDRDKHVVRVTRCVVRQQMCQLVGYPVLEFVTLAKPCDHLRGIGQHLGVGGSRPDCGLRRQDPEEAGLPGNGQARERLLGFYEGHGIAPFLLKKVVKPRAGSLRGFDEFPEFVEIVAVLLQTCYAGVAIHNGAIGLEHQCTDFPRP